MLGHKQLILDRLDCKNEVDYDSYVIKPAHSTSVGMGVDFLSSTWTIEVCESELGVPCMKQTYHPGPWEVRLYKSRVWDSEAVAWRVPCVLPDCEEPFPFKTVFPWQERIQSCIDRAFPNSPFLAVDLRTNGTNVLILEINGAFGMPYHWATQKGHVAVIVEHYQWITQRISSGIYNLSIENLIKLLLLGIERQAMKKVKGNIWF